PLLVQRLAVIVVVVAGLAHRIVGAHEQTRGVAAALGGAGVAESRGDRLVAGRGVVAQRRRRLVGVLAVGEHDDDLVDAVLVVGPALGERRAAGYRAPAPGDAFRHVGASERLHGVDGVLDGLLAGCLGHVGERRDGVGRAALVRPLV